MFSKKDYLTFVAAITLIVIGYACMVLDREENGFGILTLWIAPPLLLLGFILPVIGIVGVDNIRTDSLLLALKKNLWKHAFGFGAFLVSIFTYLFTLEPTASL